MYHVYIKRLKLSKILYIYTYINYLANIYMKTNNIKLLFLQITFVSLRYIVIHTTIKFMINILAGN